MKLKENAVRIFTGKKERRETEKACAGKSASVSFLTCRPVLGGLTKFRDSFVLDRIAGCAKGSTNVALYPSFLIRVHHPRGVLFSFASLLSLSLFLLSLLISSSLYKSKDEPRCYVFLSLHLIASLSLTLSSFLSLSLALSSSFFNLPFPLSLVPASSRSQRRPPAPCIASDDALYAAPVILLASILLASTFSVVQGLPKRA